MDFAGLEKLAGMDEPAAVIQCVHGKRMVAAPAEMDRINRAAGGKEKAGEAVVRGASAPAFLEPDIARGGFGQQVELAAPHASEKGDLARPFAGEQRGGGAAFERVGAVAFVGQHRAHGDDAGLKRFQQDGKAQPGDRVARFQRGAGAFGLGRPAGELGREAAAVTVPGKRGPAEEAHAARRQQHGRRRGVVHAVDPHRPCRNRREIAG